MDVGIIGGADGPTQVLVTGTYSPVWWIIGAAAVIALAVWFFRRRKHSRR